MTPKIFDDRVCALGEGILWHPLRKQVFWFDILGKRLLSRDGAETLSWQFDEHVSAAGWIDRDRLLIASETQLFDFNVTTGDAKHLAPLEADNPITRSNDGRADPWGGFWIGTMGKAALPQAGKIYRYFEGRVTTLFDAITISNAICFSPDKGTAYFADTKEQKIKKVALDHKGWPKGEAAVFVDLSDQNLNPDGAVVDASGNLWNAQWGASRVAQYGPAGNLIRAVEMPASQISCPAFGGDSLYQLFATSASIGAPKEDIEAGKTFAMTLGVKGQSEYQVEL